MIFHINIIIYKEGVNMKNGKNYEKKNKKINKLIYQDVIDFNEKK